MIQDPERKLASFGTIKHIRAAGYRIKTVNGVVQTSDDNAVQALIDSYNPLPWERDQAKQKIIEAINAEFEALENQYPETEKKRFAKQELEFDAYTADNNAATPTIDAIALERGVNRIWQINKVGEKVVAYRNLVNVAAGKRQKLFDQIESETDINAIRATVWE